MEGVTWLKDWVHVLVKSVQFQSKIGYILDICWCAQAN